MVCTIQIDTVEQLENRIEDAVTITQNNRLMLERIPDI
jgi:hypothetical protein